MTAYVKFNDTRRTGAFLGVAGCNSNRSTILGWQASNIRGQSTRVVTSTLQVGFSAIGGMYLCICGIYAGGGSDSADMFMGRGCYQIFTIVTGAGSWPYHYVVNRRPDRSHAAVEGLGTLRYTDVMIRAKI